MDITKNFSQSRFMTILGENDLALWVESVIVCQEKR